MTGQTVSSERYHRQVQSTARVPRAVIANYKNTSPVSIVYCSIAVEMYCLKKIPQDSNVEDMLVCMLGDC